MAACLADNSFSWSKLKKSITAVWKCNASAVWSPTAPQWDTRPRGEERRGGGGEHLWWCATSDELHCSLSRQPVTGGRAWKGPRAGMKPQISRAASTSPNLLHSLPGSYSSSHLRCASHKHAACSSYVEELKMSEETGTLNRPAHVPPLTILLCIYLQWWGKDDAPLSLKGFLGTLMLEGLDPEPEHRHKQRLKSNIRYCWSDFISYIFGDCDQWPLTFWLLTWPRTSDPKPNSTLTQT